MAVKKATTKVTEKKETAAKVVKADPVKAETAKAEQKKPEPVSTVQKETKTEAPRAIETKKDTTKKLETKAGVLVDTPSSEETVSVGAKAAQKAMTPKKATPKKTTPKRTTAKAAEKTASKKTVSVKKTEKADSVKAEIFLQFAGKEYSQEEIIQKVKDIWTYDLNKDVSEIKEIQIYLKPEEFAAYYVVNGVESGKIVL